jgi:hypothetical protein
LTCEGLDVVESLDLEIAGSVMVAANADELSAVEELSNVVVDHRLINCRKMKDGSLAGCVEDEVCAAEVFVEGEKFWIAGSVTDEATD